MTANFIQAKYDELDQISAGLLEQAKTAYVVYVELLVAHSELAGEWIGFGKEKFDIEMEDEILPALKRLETALESAAAVVDKIYHQFQSAEFDRGVQIKNMIAFPPSNIANLYDILGNMYTATDEAYFEEDKGVDRPIKIIQNGPNDFVIFINGTDGFKDGDMGGNDWFANPSTSRGFPSSYQNHAKSLILENIPNGANINLVGHSQGGHVVMNLADNQSLAEQFNINSVITFGSSGSSTINPALAADKYHTFILQDDPLRILDDNSYGRLIPSLFAVASGFPGSGLSPSIDPLVLPASPDPIWVEGIDGPHLSYGESSFLQNSTLPFDVEQWNEIGSFAAGSETYSNGRISYETLMTGKESFTTAPLQSTDQILAGSLGIIEDIGVSTLFSVYENNVNIMTQYLPSDWEIFLDHHIDQLGETLSDRPPISDFLLDPADFLFGGK